MCCEAFSVLFRFTIFRDHVREDHRGLQGRQGLRNRRDLCGRQGHVRDQKGLYIQGHEDLPWEAAQRTGREDDDGDDDILRSGAVCKMQ